MKSCHGEKHQSESLGPGYMGWNIPDGEHENLNENKKLKEMEYKIAELEKEKK